MGALCSRPDAEAERPAPAASRTAEAPPVTLQKPGSSSSQTVGASSSFSSPSRAPAAPVAPTVWTTAALSTRYTPMEKLGSGAFGVVMRVISKEAGREFADKVMKRAEAEAAGKLDRLLREIEIWQKPTHPNILRLIEVVETADELHLITEICRGGELFDQLDAVDTFSEHECRLVVAQIAGAVAHLHLAHGIAHCDIKPQNILCRSSKVTDAGCIKLSDFGAAQLFAAGAADAFVETCGTLEYYAPELCENLISRQRGCDVSAATPYGPAVDLWALGCVAYELLCGEPPFWSKDDSEQVRLILAHDLAFPDECFAAVSAPAKELIRLLLAAEPARRLAIDGALAHGWLASVDDPQISAALAASLPAATRERRSSTSSVRRSFSGGPRVGQQRSASLVALSHSELLLPALELDEADDDDEVVRRKTTRRANSLPAGASSPRVAVEEVRTEQV